MAEKMKRTMSIEASKMVGKKVRLCGWVDRRRDHGKLVFIDLKDRQGLIQVVGQEKLGDLRIGDVIEIVGKVNKRPAKMINSKLPTGKIEVAVEKIKVLARSADLPFDLRSEGHEIGEEVRLKYRYLDLRRPRMVRNLELRHQTTKFIRDWLDKKGFIEIETPYISKATPEGARDFLIPARLKPGTFYALPQSPQQYKQLLMVAGLEKYFQLARCFRDEDPRADRAYGEFTQLDIEMSFVTQEEILTLIENLFKEITEKVLKKKVWKFPFPRLAYEEVVKKYGTDKPDLRPDKKDPDLMAFAFVVDFPMFEWRKTENRWHYMHHPFTAPKEKEIPLLDKDPSKAHSYQHDFVCNGFEVGGGSIRITDPKLQEKVFKILGHSEKEIKKKFGHLLQAFEYGVPPHGGIAAGIDRFLMAGLNEPSLREVIAFPATAGGQMAVMGEPIAVETERLRELGVQTVKPRKAKAS